MFNERKVVGCKFEYYLFNKFVWNDYYQFSNNITLNTKCICLPSQSQPKESIENLLLFLFYFIVVKSLNMRSAFLTDIYVYTILDL
jgi:hypothetical protein